MAKSKPSKSSAGLVNDGTAARLLVQRNCSELPCVDALLAPLLSADTFVSATSAVTALNTTLWEVKTSAALETEILSRLTQQSISCNEILKNSKTQLCPPLVAQMFHLTDFVYRINLHFRVTDGLQQKVRSAAESCW